MVAVGAGGGEGLADVADGGDGVEVVEEGEGGEMDYLGDFAGAEETYAEFLGGRHCETIGVSLMKKMGTKMLIGKHFGGFVGTILRCSGCTTAVFLDSTLRLHSYSHCQI